jgi:hypothetical protein
MQCHQLDANSAHLGHNTGMRSVNNFVALPAPLNQTSGCFHAKGKQTAGMKPTACQLHGTIKPQMFPMQHNAAHTLHILLSLPPVQELRLRSYSCT